MADIKDESTIASDSIICIYNVSITKLTHMSSMNITARSKKRNSDPLTDLDMKKTIEATIVGAAEGLDLALLGTDSDIFALNSAYFHLIERNIQPTALITGDKRFINRTGTQIMSTVNRVITFLDVDAAVNNKHLDNLPSIELCRCLGRDGFSSDRNAGFYHGCSSFFFAVQYLVSSGYKTIRTIGINFPPPETYNRLNGVTGHPEFVYDIQLKNLASLKKFLNDTNTEIQCIDMHSNLNIFL